MVFRPVERQSVFQNIQQQLRAYLIENKLKPGDMLPSATEMAEAMGVSPGSLREALRALESLGVLEIRHGVGTVVKAYDLTPILENLSFSLLFEPDSLHDLVQVREAIETALLPEVISLIDDAQLGRLEELVERMGSRDDEKDDHAFHCALYQCLGNKLVLHLIDIFWLVYHDLVERHELPAKKPHENRRSHEPIFEAIKNRDVAGAVSALRTHFDEVKGALRFVRATSDTHGKTFG